MPPALIPGIDGTSIADCMDLECVCQIPVLSSTTCMELDSFFPAGPAGLGVCLPELTFNLLT
eukprot:1156780-Pelagomonas_calceolata.AAC.6